MKKLFTSLAVVAMTILAIPAFAEDSGVTVGVRFFGSGDTTTSSTSPLFTGSAKSDSAVELYAKMHPAKYWNALPQGVTAELYASSSSLKHEVLFVGASLGGYKSDTAYGGSIGYEFDTGSYWKPYVTAGVEYRSWDGQYALGGAAFPNQKKPDSTVGTFSVGVIVDMQKLTGWKNVSLSASVKHTGEQSSEVTPLPGATVKSKSGGDTKAGIGLAYSF